MHPRPRPLISRSHATWLRRVAFALAMIAQFVGAMTAVAEGRAGRGFGAHVEGPGTRSHFVHDESTCVACHVRSMHGREAATPRLAVVPPEVARSIPFSGPLAPPRVELTPDNPSRAPPVLS